MRQAQIIEHAIVIMRDVKSAEKTTSASSSSISNANDAPTSQKAPGMSGFEEHRTTVEIGLVIFSILYGSIYSWNPQFLPVNSQYCHDGQPSSCLRSDLIGYKFTSLITMSYIGCRAFYRWHFSRSLQQEYDTIKAKDDAQTLAQYRVFGTVNSDTSSSLIVSASNDQNIAMLCYQVWDIAVSLAIPEYRRPIFLAHHAVTAVAVYCSLEYRLVPFYSVYYAGCSEFSTIFLILANLDTLLHLDDDSLMRSILSQTVGASQGLFTITFFLYRVVGWIYYMVPLFSDCLLLSRTGKAEQKRPGTVSFLYVFLGISVLLGTLQLYWMYLIVIKVSSMLLLNDN